jgi:hypothetical protein
MVKNTRMAVRLTKGRGGARIEFSAKLGKMEAKRHAMLEM